jgi:CelD/BcsL family acetyltransferase involved in cellulose biosynthesis
MQVVRINTLEEFDGLKSAWNAACEADSHATVFLSWDWLRGWFEATPYAWSVLAARPAPHSPCVAFFPVGKRRVRRCGIDLVRELRMGGSPCADYTGFICPAEYEREAIPAFAAHVQENMRWDRFHLQDVVDPRLELFLEHFPAERYEIQHADSLPCLYVPLPSDWDHFAQESLGRWARRDISRFFRRLEEGGEFRMAHAQDGDPQVQIEAMLGLWKLQWAKGRNLERECAVYRAIFRRCLARGCLWLAVLWHGERPSAGLAAFVDRRNGAFSAYIAAYDPQYAKLSPGKGMCGYGIRYAIENGFRVFDFLRGHAEYKLLFNPETRFNQSALVRRRNLRRAVGKLARRWWSPMAGLR